MLLLSTNRIRGYLLAGVVLWERSYLTSPGLSLVAIEEDPCLVFKYDTSSSSSTG